MRFETKFDRWVVSIVVLGVVVGCAIPVVLMLLLPVREPLFGLLPFVPLVPLAALASSLPQYYEVREDGLFIRQGWRKVLLPYASLRELRRERNFFSAPVFSTDRIFLSTNIGKKLVIAVDDDERFLTEVKRRAPNLEKRSWGLGTAFYPPAFLAANGK